MSHPVRGEHDFEVVHITHTHCMDIYGIVVLIFTNTSARAGYDTRSIFKQSLTSLNSEFSFSYTSCLTKAEKPSLPNYLPIAGGWIVRFITFPRVIVLCEMQSVSSRIWTRVAVSISFDDNHYTTGTTRIPHTHTYIHIHIYIYICVCVCVCVCIYSTPLRDATQAKY